VRFLVIVCLLRLLSSGTTLSASAAPLQACLPTVQGQPTTPPAQAGTLLINEVLLSSKQTWSCPGSTSVPDAEDNSWIELYNPMALSFNLYTVHAAIDGGPGTTSMYLPFGSAITARGFLTIFPAKSIIFPNGAPETFTRRLLFSGTVIDQITLPSNLGEDQSYARIPDGGSRWEITNTPTIGISNVLPTPTPKPLPTPKPVTVKKKSSSKTSLKTSSKTTSSKTTSAQTDTTTGGSTNPSLASGVQPAWSQLQLPTTPATEPAAVSPLDATTIPSPTNSTNGDVLRNMLFAGVAIVLVGALLLWWRRFKHP
jgi:hypothetical protein